MENPTKGLLVPALDKLDTELNARGVTALDALDHGIHDRVDPVLVSFGVLPGDEFGSDSHPELCRELPVASPDAVEAPITGAVVIVGFHAWACPPCVGLSARRDWGG